MSPPLKLAYISPSVIPSRSANSVHVVHQCVALAAEGAHLTLYFKQGVVVDGRDELRAQIEAHYGTSLDGVELAPYHSSLNKGDNLGIAFSALAHMLRRGRPGVMVSRNLYFSFLASLFCPQRLIFETHHIETGLRGLMQKIILGRRQIKVVLISQALREALEKQICAIKGQVAILPDAAPAGMEPDRRSARRFLAEHWLVPAGHLQESKVCGYFGQLFAGRGIEIIEFLARAMPQVVFLIFGGDDEAVRRAREKNSCPNLVYAGFVPNQQARIAMQGCDVLLMPYQEKVSIGMRGHDTARWMSPMKMFEYMASGSPLVASDLPVLREVLRDGRNALLVPPAEPGQWEQAVRRLLEDPELARTLAAQAYEEYRSTHNWHVRARRILELAR